MFGQTKSGQNQVWPNEVGPNQVWPTKLGQNQVWPDHALGLQTFTFEGPGALNTTKIAREDPKRERKGTKWGEGKKREILGPPPFGAPFFWVRGPTPFAPPPHPFGPPPPPPFPNSPYQEPPTRTPPGPPPAWTILTPTPTRTNPTWTPHP